MKKAGIQKLNWILLFINLTCVAHAGDNATGSENIQLDTRESISDSNAMMFVDLKPLREDFNIAEWGQFWKVNYLSKDYFAGYGSGLLCDLSKDKDLTKNKQLSGILSYSSVERTITSSSPLELEDGYELALESIDIDGNNAYVALSRYGEEVDSSIINIYSSQVDYDGVAASNDDTYIYRINRETPDEKAIISVHFLNAFKSSNNDMATVDKIWQAAENFPSKVLYRNDKPQIITSERPLMLQEGYELALKSIDIDGNKVYLELSKEGEVIDSKVVRSLNEGPETYTFVADPGSPKERETISVHFKSVLRGADQDVAMVDRIRQISENHVLISDDSCNIVTSGSPLKLKEGYELAIRSTDNNGAKSLVELSKDGKVIDSKVIIPTNNEPDTCTYTYTANDGDSRSGETISVHFRNAFCGADYSLATVDRVWQSFKNMSDDVYYDDRVRTIEPYASLELKDGYNLSLRAVDISSNKLFVELDKKGNVVDSAIIQLRNDGPETYTYAVDMGNGSEMEIVSVHLKAVFRGVDVNIATTDEIWQISGDDPSKILMDEAQDRVISSGNPLRLKEGYDLAIKSVDLDGNKAYMELYKDGMVIDSKIVEAPKPKGDMKTYVYRKELGRTEGIVVIAVHFKNAFRGADQNIATIDGVWQLSELPVTIG